MSQETSWALDLGALVERPRFHQMSPFALQTLVLLLDQCRRQHCNPVIVVLGGFDPSFADLERDGWLSKTPESGGVTLSTLAVSLLVPFGGRLRVSPVAVGQTRADALAVACPECGAGAGFPCIGKRRGGANRAAPHAARYAAARGA